MDDKDLKALSRSLAALKQAGKRLNQSLSELCSQSSMHGEKARLAQVNLTNAVVEHANLVTVAASQRAERALLTLVDEARQQLRVARGAAPALKRAMDSAEMAAKRIGSAEEDACRAAEALSTLLNDLGAALDTAWRQFLLSPDANALWRGLETERSAGLDGVRMHLQLLAQWDALDAQVAGTKRTGAQGVSLGARARQLLLEDAETRVMDVLRTARRLVSSSDSVHMSTAATFPPAFLPALAEAAAVTSKPLRSLAVVFETLAADDAEAWLAAADTMLSASGVSDDEGATAEFVGVLSATMSARQAELQQLEPKAATLRAFSGSMAELLSQQLNAGPRLITAAVTSPGRDALIQLAEAGETFEQGALARHSGSQNAEGNLQ